MSNSQEDFEKKLSEARIKYINNLPGKISEITLIWNQLNKEDWQQELLLKMINLTHNLAGSGGTFGIPKLSEHAKLLEQTLNELKNDGYDQKNREKIIKINSLLLSLQTMELSITLKNTVLPKTLNRNNVIYILDANKDESLLTYRQLIHLGCSIEIINDISDLEVNLHCASPLLILIDADFAESTFGKSSVIKTLRKDWVLTCPIIYISYRYDFQSRMAAIRSSANAYFTKPLDISLLIERIHILTNAGIVDPYRILLVEDDVELASYYTMILEKVGMKVFVETQGELVLSKILQLNPELVVMDLYMPNYNGIDLINVIRQHQSLFTIPIVLLTAENDVNLQFLAREVGVDDFLQKPITELHLFEAVLNRVQRARYMNITMAKDGLTGLFVHKKIIESLEMHINICKRYNHTLSYVILDIDKFKVVNDTYGHLAGDNVLVSLANVLKSEVRNTDFVARYGGEEFVIISPETDEIAMYKTIDRIRKKFENITHYHETKAFKVTFSAGISSFPKYDCLDLIMAEADKALYKSKHNGRNQITIA